MKMKPANASLRLLQDFPATAFKMLFCLTHHNWKEYSADAKIPCGTKPGHNEEGVDP